MTELEALIILNAITDIGGIRLGRLLEYFDSAKKVLETTEENLQKVEGISKDIASKIKNLSKNKIDLNKELNLVKKNNIQILTINDKDYPVSLKAIASAPVILYVKGKILNQDLVSVSLVGSRRASFYGLTCAENLARDLATRGICVVSGMARGIDTASHKGALKAGGRTIAILGSGLNYIYPPENKELAENISKNGAVVSEFPMDTPPLAKNFPRRNRLISGFSLGTVIIEAARNSGALITSDFALEQGKDVFAVPGKIDASGSWGTNQLIKQGAKLINNIEDIIEELELKNIKIKNQDSIDKNTSFVKLNLKPDEEKVLNCLNSDGKYLDDIIENSNLPLLKINEILLKLEMKHLIKQLPGKIFTKVD